MGKVIEFKDYMRNKSNLVSRALESEEMREPLAGMALETQLVSSGLVHARVFHENNSYVVILGLSFWTYIKFWLMMKWSHGKNLKDSLEAILKKTNPDTDKVYVYRKFPSRRRAKKILKELGINAS